MMQTLYRISIGLRTKHGGLVTQAQIDRMVTDFAVAMRGGGGSYFKCGGVWHGAQEGSLIFEAAGNGAMRIAMETFARHAAWVADQDSAAFLTMPCHLDFLPAGEAL